MRRFSAYALYLIFNYYDNNNTNTTPDTTPNTNLFIENNTLIDVCKGDLEYQKYKGINCDEDDPYLQCCQENLDKILNKSVEINTCSHYTNDVNYSNMLVGCEINENIFYEFFIVIGFSIISVMFMVYCFYHLYKKCFKNGYNYYYLNIDNNLETSYQ